jgi:hypothetical protein
VKLRALVALIALALAGASLAYAAPKAMNGNGNGNGPKTDTSTTTTTHGKKPPKTGPGCKPAVAVILKGTYTGTTDTTNDFIVVNVTGGNHHAKAYKALGNNNVYYTSSTKFNGPGHHAVGDLKTGDRLVVRAPVCKADLANGGTPTLTAKRVTAHTPKS